MDLRHARYFIAVAEELNFTRAAARVGIGQPPLSQQIRDLEKELGAPLFRRLPHGAELTPVGEAFLPEAKALIAQADRAMRTAQRVGRGEGGRLRVGFTGSAAFHPAVPASIRDFRRAYPGVELTLEELPTGELLARLASGAVDAVFVRPGQTSLPEAREYEVAKEPMVVVLPSTHRLARRPAIQLPDLAGESLLLFPREAGPGLFDEIIGACRRDGFEPTLGPVIPQMTSVANLVSTEAGIAFVPESLSRMKTFGVTYRRLADDPLIARLVFMTRLREESVVVRHFLGMVAEAAKKRDAQTSG